MMKTRNQSFGTRILKTKILCNPSSSNPYLRSITLSESTLVVCFCFVALSVALSVLSCSVLRSTPTSPPVSTNSPLRFLVPLFDLFYPVCSLVFSVQHFEGTDRRDTYFLYLEHIHSFADGSNSNPHPQRNEERNNYWQWDMNVPQVRRLDSKREGRVHTTRDKP